MRVKARACPVEATGTDNVTHGRGDEGLANDFIELRVRGALMGRREGGRGKRGRKEAGAGMDGIAQV